MTSPFEPKHHPSIETLTAYAAGVQRAGFDVVTGAHVMACAHCRAQTATLECLGGMALTDASPTALSEDALARVLARLDAPEPAPPPSRSIEDMLGAAKRRWVAPGVWVAKIDTPHAPEDRVYMLSSAPGAVTAKHSHHGLEFTQVLRGALDDEGVIYRAGDFTERDESHLHHPSTHGDEPCVCLFATHGLLQPTGWLGRIAFALAGV